MPGCDPKATLLLICPMAVSSVVGLARSGAPSLGECVEREAMKIDAKRVLLWSFIAGVGFSAGEMLVTTPIYLHKAWMQATHFGG